MERTERMEKNVLWSNAYSMARDTLELIQGDGQDDRLYSVDGHQKR